MITKLLSSVAWSTSPTLSLKGLLESLISRIGNLEVSNQRIGRGAIGESFMFSGVSVPVGALVEDGSAVPRLTYGALLNIIAPEYGVVITNGSTQVTGLSAFAIALLGGTGTKTPQIPVEGIGLPVGCKIASIAGTTLTLSAPATAAGTTIRIFFHGNGDGNTTYNLPDGRAEIWRGVDLNKLVDTGRVLCSSHAASVIPAMHTYRATATTGLVVGPVASSMTDGEQVSVTGDSISPTSTGPHFSVGLTAGSNFGGPKAWGARPKTVAKLPCIWAL